MCVLLEINFLLKLSEKTFCVVSIASLSPIDRINVAIDGFASVDYAYFLVVLLLASPILGKVKKMDFWINY